MRLVISGSSVTRSTRSPTDAWTGSLAQDGTAVEKAHVAELAGLNQRLGNWNGRLRLTVRGGNGAGGFDKRHNFARASSYPRQYVQFNEISGDGRADYLVIYDGGAVRAWLNRGGNS